MMKNEPHTKATCAIESLPTDTIIEYNNCITM